MTQECVESLSSVPNSPDEFIQSANTSTGALIASIDQVDSQREVIHAVV